jgi:trehalose 6-phosphate phosphatase
MEDLQSQIDEASQAAGLLVATDYDGTLAPLVSHPDLAEAHRESVVALKQLAAMPQTHVAIISGRSLADLGKHFKDLEHVHLVGGHGSEFEFGFAKPIAPERLALLQKVEDEAKRIAAQVPGTMVERKPAGIAFHYRNADEKTSIEKIDELLKTFAGNPDVFVRHGKKIVELSVVETDKGKALQSLRHRVGASVVIFLGDDVTDEDAFATLSGADIGIKVGEGHTTAKFRLPTPLDVARLLAGIAEKRSAWLAGAAALPIQSYSLLSDQRTCALVSSQGRMSWLCLPRIDSAAIFADLVGGPSAGFFDARPVNGAGNPKQKYSESSFVLQTDWGSMRVTDYLDCSDRRPTEPAGRTDLIRVIEGKGTVRITYAPRVDFGRQETRLISSDGGLGIKGAVDPCVLYAPGVCWKIAQEGKHDTAVAEADLGAEALVLELRFGTASMAPIATTEFQRREQTDRFWSQWARTLKLPAIAREQVLRSALVLRALCYGPTGAIAAAATTSLPEHPGGVRNWDYRFCWRRDGSMAATALARLGDTATGMKLLDWMLGIFESHELNSLIRPVYTVTGAHLAAEGVIAELAGYRGSRPVRVGNGAAHQVQLDVLGPLAHLISLLAQRGAALTPEHWRMCETMVAAVAQRWCEEDHGIWEIRSSRKQHVHSKVNCWYAVNCALSVAEFFQHRRDEWVNLRKEIRDDVLANGWNEQVRAFCSSYGSSEIDAASLSVGLSGMIPPDDPRFASTVEAVERELLRGPVVFRYKYDDGLPGIEGGFNLCTTWLIQAYAMLGRWKEAQDLFARYVALGGPTGLMAEEYDPVSKLALGNFPQAYSHIGLINCALRLAEAPSLTESAEKAASPGPRSGS